MRNKMIKLILVTLAVYLGMKFLVPMALPFFIALVLARFLYPLANWLEKKQNIRKTTSRFLTYGVFLVGIGCIAAGLIYLCYRMGSSCLENLQELMETADRIFCTCCDQLEQITGFGTEEIQRTVSQGAGNLTEGAVKYSKDAGWYMAGLLAKVFVTFIAVFLVLNEYENIINGMQKNQIGKRVMDMLRGMKTASGAYIRAQLKIMGIVTAVCIGGLFLLGVDHAFWIGLGVGFCDALPFIGTGTIFVPWALIEILLGEYLRAAGFIAIYFACSFLRQMLEPKLVGKGLGVPPLAVLMSIYIGVQLYGGAGVIFGPVSALIIWEVYQFL